jgi:hypothetical protein
MENVVLIMRPSCIRPVRPLCGLMLDIAAVKDDDYNNDSNNNNGISHFGL